MVEVEAEHLAQQDFDIGMLRQDVANGSGNLRRRNSRSRDLLQQRLESVMVLAIQEGDLYGQTGQRLGSLQAAKSASHDDHTGTGFVIHGYTS